MINNVGKFVVHKSEIIEAERYSGLKNDGQANMIYEVIRVINGKPLFFDDHYERLINSFRSVGKTPAITYEELKQSVGALIEANENYDCNVMLEVIADDHQDWDLYIRKSHYPEVKVYETGVKVGTIGLEREIPEAKIWDKNYKNKVDDEISKNNYFEVLLVNHDGFITEGSRSNVFFVKGNKVFTAPAKYVLRGITSIYAIKCCETEHVEVVSELIPAEEIPELDGAFITGTSVNILPVAFINDIPIGSAQNHIIQKLMKRLDIVIREQCSDQE